MDIISSRLETSLKMEVCSEEFSYKMDELPSEVLEEILLRIDTRILLSFSDVCAKWSTIINSVHFWKRKAEYLGFHIPQEVLQNQNIPWKFFYSILLNNCGIPYQKNLIVNGSGELEADEDKINVGNRNEQDFDESWFASWNTLSSGGQGWRIFKSLPPQNVPQGAESNSYFATSNFSCTKEQFLSLSEKGIDSDILDTFQPDIEIEEFYSKCENHGASYELQVCLLDGCGNVLGNSFSFRKNMKAEDSITWKKVTHIFKDYGVGARYVKYYHGGMAEDMEEGWFGSKMTGASVKVKFPEFQKTEAIFQCQCRTKHKMNLKLR